MCWSFSFLLYSGTEQTELFPFRLSDGKEKSSRMNCELLATCSALGYLEGDTYHKEADCLGEYLFMFSIVRGNVDKLVNITPVIL